MVLRSLAEGIFDTAQDVYDAGTSLVGPTTIRLGVTGLARSGKTVFITSLVANLLDRGRMPHLLASQEGRIETAYLQPQPDDTVPRFEYENHLGELKSKPPIWPDSTRSISELRLSLRVRPKGLLAGVQGTRTIHLDIVDYPGEWLLDLGLLERSYDEWSAQSLERIEKRAAGRDYRQRVSALDPEAPLDEVQAQALAECFTEYLHHARAEGYYDCTPGRFLLPGDLAGSPVLTFSPLPPSQPLRRSLRREFERRFEAYKQRVVRPFFREHFARIDRQIILTDVLTAISSGPAAVDDMREGLAEILAAFRPGRNSFLSQIFAGKRVEKILFAATKADHLHHSQHEQLTAIMEALTRDARDRARFAGAKTSALAIAALRSTTEETRRHEGRELQLVRGRLLESQKQAAFYAGTLPRDPSAILAPAQSGASDWLTDEYGLMQFAPPELSLRPGDGPPHIRLDRAAEFLIGDKL